MTETSKTAKKSAAKLSPKPKAVLTTEQALAEIRRLRAARLFVGDMEYVDKLLAEYDRLSAAHALMSSENEALRQDIGLECEAHKQSILRLKKGEQAAEDALALLNTHLKGRTYTDLDDALRNMLQAYVTTKGNYEDLLKDAQELDRLYKAATAESGGRFD